MTPEEKALYDILETAGEELIALQHALYTSETWRHAYLQQVTALQTRCTELTEELRALQK